MTPRGAPLSENGKLIAMCLLFPIFWPFLPVLLACMAGEAIRNRYWDWKYRRAERHAERLERAVPRSDAPAQTEE